MAANHTTLTSTTYRCQFGETFKLTPENYRQWSNDERTCLRSENALGIVERTELRPGGQSQPAIQAAKQYDIRLGKAYALIHATCMPAARTYLRNLEHPADMWESLKDTSEAVHSQTGTMALVRSFTNHRLREADSRINVYIVRLLDIRDALTETGDQITERSVIAHLMNTLLLSFGMIQRVINVKPRADHTLEYIIRTLLEEESAFKIEHTDADTSLTSGTALAAVATSPNPLHGRGCSRGSYRASYRGRGRGGYSHGGIRSRTSMDSWNCNKVGHSRVDCRGLKKEPDTRAHAAFTIVRSLMAYICSTDITWIIDYGASHHLCRESSDFTELNTMTHHIEVFVGDASTITAPEFDTIRLLLRTGSTLTIEALHVLKLKTSLLSVRRLHQLHPVTFNHNHCTVRELIISRRNDHVFEFIGSVIRIATAAAATAAVAQISGELWYQRLGHLGRQSVRDLLKSELMPELIHVNNTTDDSDEEPEFGNSANAGSDPDPSSTWLVCVKAKQQRHYTRKLVERTTAPFQLVHSDQCRPINPPLAAGARYFIL